MAGTAPEQEHSRKRRQGRRRGSLTPELIVKESLRLLDENGPEITQAGQRNYVKTSAKVGFEHHPGAWPDGVRYYAHALPR